MLASYIPIGVIVILAVIFGFFIIALGTLFGPRRKTARKVMPYESGMTPIGPGTRRIPVRFYLVAVLFILFDIEAIFLYPWAVVYRSLKMFAFVEMLVFVVLIVSGFFYVWKKGALDWSGAGRTRPRS